MFHTYQSGSPRPNLRLESTSGFTTVSGLISNWADQSGYGNNAFQNTTSYRPTYAASDASMNNLPSATFSAGGDDSMQITGSSSLNFSTNGFSIYIVANIQSWFSTYSMLMQHSNGSTWTQGWGMFVTGSQMRFFVQNWNNSANYVSLTAPLTGYRTLFKFTWNKTVMNASYRQNSTTTSGTKNYSGAYTNPTEALEIMRGGFGATSYDTSGKLGAIFMYNRALNSSEDGAIQNYLKSKYNIA